MVENKAIPNVQDWGEIGDDFELETVFNIYGGKSNKEMEPRFLVSPVEASSELQIMPAVPFQYYILGFRDSVMSLKHDQFVLADSGSCFLRLILYKLRNSSDSIKPIFKSLENAIEYISTNQEKYDADEDIYGKFYDLKKEIYELV